MVAPGGGLPGCQWRSVRLKQAGANRRGGRRTSRRSQAEELASGVWQQVDVEQTNRKGGSPCFASMKLRQCWLPNATTPTLAVDLDQQSMRRGESGGESVS